MNINTLKSFRRCLKASDDATLESAAQAMQFAAAIFGHPHLHSGRGIRDLGKGLYECRAGLSLRLLFRRKEDALVFEFAGTHDEVRAWLKKRR
jgi:mRNA-degrading endonuclease YafQ of YafQ-DinJ toxin-antitoxin module